MGNRNAPHPENPPARLRRQRVENADFSEDKASEETRDTPSVENESELRLGGDIGSDRVIGPDEAGLGGSLDQAEEAQLGITDEELAEMARRRGARED